MTRALQDLAFSEYLLVMKIPLKYISKLVYFTHVFLLRGGGGGLLQYQEIQLLKRIAVYDHVLYLFGLFYMTFAGNILCSGPRNL